MLDIRSLSKIYPNGTHALQDFSLSIGKGELVAVIGGSGCGKSTLLRLLSGLEGPTQGEISLEGRLLTEPDSLVNIVFQEPRLFPWLTVADNIGFGLRHLASSERDEQVSAALEKIGLRGHEKRWIKELSGGQAQRVALARALVTKLSRSPIGRALLRARCDDACRTPGSSDRSMARECHDDAACHARHRRGGLFGGSRRRDAPLAGTHSRGGRYRPAATTQSHVGRIGRSQKASFRPSGSFSQ